MTTLTALLVATTDRSPHGLAVTDGDGALTWIEFSAKVDLAAARLVEAGIGNADRVALWLPNSADALALVFACARLGALAVNINTRFRADEVASLLQRSQARALVTEWGFQPVDFPSIIASIPAKKRPDLRTIIGRHLPREFQAIHGVTTISLSGPTSRLPPQNATPQSPIVTFTTSGTTSGPKLVVHDQASISGHAADVARAIGLDKAGAALLAAVPFCGTFGLTAAMASVAGGAHIVCMDRFDGPLAVQLIHRYTITHAIGGDDMLARIIAAADGQPFKTVRWFGFAAFSSAAPATAIAAEAIGLNPHGVYGSSEVQALFAVGHGDNRLQSGGQPVSAAAEVSVRDPNTCEALDAGQPGELCFRAPSRFRGYLNDDDATRRATTGDGFFRSGDLGRIEDSGFVFEARLGDTMRLRGFLVSPEEIEGFLANLPGVSGAQVVGVEINGAIQPVAFVTAQAGVKLDHRDLTQRCIEGLAHFKNPALIIEIDEFPTVDGPNGRKIQRVRLREMATLVTDPLREGGR